MSETTTADSAADQARAKTQEVGAQAKDKAQEAGRKARGRVRDEVDRRSTQAGEQAGTTADALRQTSRRLREDGNEPIANGMEQVAQRVESAGTWLRESDGDRILRDVEDFGRRNPLAVVAGGLALGFAASRLLKASSRRRYEETGWTGNGRATTPRETDLGAPPVTTRREPGLGTPPVTTPRETDLGTPPVTTPRAPGVGTGAPPPPSTGWRDPDVTP